VSKTEKAGTPLQRSVRPGLDPHYKDVCAGEQRGRRMWRQKVAMEQPDPAETEAGTGMAVVHPLLPTAVRPKQRRGRDLDFDATDS
jgi:hypothetical protein